MNKTFFSTATLWMALSIGCMHAEVFRLNGLTSSQFESGGTDQWCFERHDLATGTFARFTQFGDSSNAVNYYDQYLTERFGMYPIMDRPSAGTQFEVRRKAWYSGKDEYVYVAAEYPTGTKVGTNLTYGVNYPDSLTGYEVYAVSGGLNAAITFTVPEDGFYRADMTVLRQDLWSNIGVMKVYQYFRYGGDGKAYSLGKEFSYGASKGIDSWSNSSVYAQYLALIPETPTVNGNSGKPFRGLPTGSTKEVLYFYAHQGDKISFEADARSTGNGETTPRGAYARTKWVDLTISTVDETEAIGSARLVNPYVEDKALKAAFDSVLVEAEDVYMHEGYSLELRNELALLFSSIYQRYMDDAILTLEMPSLIDQLQRAIDVCRASESGLKVRYTFEGSLKDSVPDASGQNHVGTLKNGATVVALGKYHVLSLGGNNGYLDMGSLLGQSVSGLGDYTLSAYYRIDPGATLSGNGFMLFAFSTLEANSSANGQYLFFRMVDHSLSTSASGWSSATTLSAATAPQKGQWQHLVIRQSGDQCTLFLNGAAVKTGTLPSPKSKLTAITAFNWIGRPPFSGDNYLKNTMVYDFKLYNSALPDDSIAAWTAVVSDLEQETNYGTDGDYTALDALIKDGSAALTSAVVGDVAGQYPAAAMEIFDGVLKESQALSTARLSSQIRIDAEIVKLKAAFATFVGSVNVETNALSDGYYHIVLSDSLYLTNPGMTVLANGTALQLSNGGLSTRKITTDSSQVFLVKKVTALTPPRYSIYSRVNDNGVYRHLTENVVFQSTWGSSDNNWRTYNLLYNGSAYAVACAGSAVSSGKKGYWYGDAANKKLAVSASGSSAVFDFQFVPFVATGIKDARLRNASLWVDGGRLHIRTAEPAELLVYDLAGVVVHRSVRSGQSEIELKKGVYIVRWQGRVDEVEKVVIR